MMSVNSSNTAISMAEAPPAAEVAFPNAKINLGLQVKGQRSDGFHAIDSLFIPIPWCDTLEIATARDRKSGCKLHLQGNPVAGSMADNLVQRAYDALNDQFDLPATDFHLIKAIPSGAGLGGGSADGTFALRLINVHFGLNLNTEALEKEAAKLGSDCPFFVRNVPAHVTGRGEQVHPISLSLDGWHIGLIHPGIHVPTKSAFQWVSPMDGRPDFSRWNGSSPVDWPGAIRNDFTAPVSEKHPEIKHALQHLINAGAVFADMSGSGSTVFGFFRNPPALDLFDACPDSWQTWAGPATL